MIHVPGSRVEEVNTRHTCSIRVCFYSLLLLSACLSSALAADSLGEKQKALTQLHKNIKQLDRDVHQLHARQQKLMALLRRQEKDVGVVFGEVRQLKQNIARQQQRLKQIGLQMAKIRRHIHDEKNALEQQIRAAYAMGRHERLKVIFNQQDPVLSSRILVYYGYLNKARLDKIQFIETQVKQLQQLQAEQTQKKTTLAKALGQRKQELEQLRRLKRQRKQTLAEIKRQFVSKKAELAQLKQNELQLKALIEKLQRQQDDFPFEEAPGKPFVQLKHKLPWPVRGKIIHKFGDTRVEGRWDGVLIGAREGANVHAVTRGRIVYADWLRGYGLLTIIDHGQGYMTLYAFNQSLFKSKGDWVEAGDVIAAVGQSGGRSQSALYFGIRKKKRPLDPLKWCRKLGNAQ